MDGTAIGRLLLHGFQILSGGGKVNVGHVDSAALDLDGNEKRFPVAGGGGLCGVEMLACFVYFNVLNGSDLYLAVVVGVGYNGGGGGFALGGAGGLVGGAGAQRQRKDQRKTHCYKLL